MKMFSLHVCLHLLASLVWIQKKLHALPVVGGHWILVSVTQYIFVVFQGGIVLFQLYEKKPPRKQRNCLQNGVKNIQIAGYNGVHTVYSLYPKGTQKYILKIKSTLVA